MSMWDFAESLSQAILVGITSVGRLGVAELVHPVSNTRLPSLGPAPGNLPYEEFTRLAETRLAQNSLNYLNIAEIALN